jgi:hypothetical protein
MSKRSRSNVNPPPRMLSAPLPNGLTLRIAEGTRCRNGHVLPNDPEPLDDWPALRVICPVCHEDVLSLERWS